MLLMLLPAQVADRWEVIKFAIEKALPPFELASPDAMNKILEDLLNGKMQCWASFQKASEALDIDGVVVTEIGESRSGLRSLLIYALYGFQQVSEKSWLDGIEALGKFARANKCMYVTAYTDIEYMVDMAKKLGGSAEYRFCMFPV